MRILLTGRNGQLGFELRRSLAVLGEVAAIDRAACDLSNEAALRQLVRHFRPDVIVNAAAYTAVDLAESDAQGAYLVNVRAAAILADEAGASGAMIIHYSTDYVFDGTKPDRYTEADTPNPISVYGKTKWQGEMAVALATPCHLIFRTSWILGVHGANFARTILRLATERSSLAVVADQRGAPTSAALLADATAHVVRRYLVGGGQKNGFPFGTYHLVANGETTWYDYARFVLTEAHKLGAVFKAGADSVRAISTSEYPTPAKRPANSTMSTGKFVGTFDLRLPPWQEGVEHIVRQIF